MQCVVKRRYTQTMRIVNESTQSKLSYIYIFQYILIRSHTEITVRDVINVCTECHARVTYYLFKSAFGQIHKQLTKCLSCSGCCVAVLIVINAHTCKSKFTDLSHSRGGIWAVLFNMCIYPLLAYDCKNHPLLFDIHVHITTYVL